MDAAAELFGTRGYEQTTTTDIMKKVGIAKGTLYYHFASKEEILDAMVERMGRRLIGKARACAAQKEVPVYQRLVQVLFSLNANEEGAQDLVEIINQPKNVLLHEKSRDLILREAGPILTELVQEGVREGIFDCEYPGQAVEMVLLYVLDAFDGQKMSEEDTGDMPERIEGFITNTEKLFGAEKGTFDFVRQLLYPFLPK